MPHVEALEAAHIVDVQCKLSAQELENLGLDTKYELYNGILLCAVCHHKYDHWACGIDKEGFLWKKQDRVWVKDESVNIYARSQTKTSPRIPHPVLLHWKFQRFVEKRDTIMSRFSERFGSLFVSPTKKKNK